jgi:hypothetical protein
VSRHTERVLAMLAFGSSKSMDCCEAAVAFEVYMGLCRPTLFLCADAVVGQRDKRLTALLLLSLYVRCCRCRRSWQQCS